jgi:hypothetical protein
MFFSDLLSNFRIWGTGDIFIVDAEGTTIANVRLHRVLERFNFIEKAKTDSQYEGMGETFSNMISVL